MELSRVGLNPLDPVWDIGCVLETNRRGKGLWIARLKSVA